MKTKFNTPCNDLDDSSNPSDEEEQLNCQNINSFPIEVLYENKVGTGLTTKRKSWIDIKRSDPETNVMANIGIKSFTKCDQIKGLRLDVALVEPNFSKEKCFKSEYWKQKFRNENVFVSFYKSQCYYSQEQNPILLSDSSALLYIHSSSC